MINVLPQVEKISVLKNNQAAVLAKVRQGPVLLMQRSNPAVVLVAPETWNALARELEHYRHLALLDEQSKRIDAGEYLTQEQVEAGLRARGLL